MLWSVPGRAALRWPTNDVVTLVTSAPDYAVGVTDEPLVGDRDAVVYRPRYARICVGPGPQATQLPGMRSGPRSGGVAQRVGEARFREPLLAQGAAIAKPAGSTVGRRLIARPRE